MIDWIGESETTIDEHEKWFNTKQYVEQRIHTVHFVYLSC